jgi:hypothetical protein
MYTLTLECLEDLLFYFPSVAEEMQNRIMKRYESFRNIRHDIARAGESSASFELKKNVEKKSSEYKQTNNSSMMSRVLSLTKMMSITETPETKDQTMKMTMRKILFNGRLTNTSDKDVIKTWCSERTKDGRLKFRVGEKTQSIETFKCCSRLREYNAYTRRITSSKIVPVDDENGSIDDDNDENNITRLETYASLASKCLVHPHSNGKMVWDLFIAVLILFSVVIVPYRIAFAVDVSGAMLVLDYMIDLLFGMDIILSFRQVVYIPAKGVWSTDNWVNGNLYFKGWFVIDILSTVPFDKIAAFFMPVSEDGNNARNLQLTRTLRLVRLLKLVRVLKLSKISGSIEDIVASPALLKLTGLLFQILFISHLIACFWFFMGDEDQGWYSSGELFGYKSESDEFYVSSL